MSANTNIITASGLRVAISPTLPATHDITGFQALSDFIDVAEVVDAGNGGKSWSTTTHSPLAEAEELILKTSFNQGTRDVSMGQDLTDAGQRALIDANDVYPAQSFRLTYQNGRITYFTATVNSYTDEDGTISSVVSATASLVLCNDILRLINSGVLTATINAGGTFTGNTDGTFTATQASTSGTGSGAEFSVTMVAGAITAALVTKTGSGYEVADTITLLVAGTTESVAAVLDVATILPTV